MCLMQAYWPFHKAICYRNEFADATQASEPKFARWMRKHQKLAVLKDDEVDRLERASVATTGNTPGHPSTGHSKTMTDPQDTKAPVIADGTCYQCASLQHAIASHGNDMTVHVQVLHEMRSWIRCTIGYSRSPKVITDMPTEHSGTPLQCMATHTPAAAAQLP